MVDIKEIKEQKTCYYTTPESQRRWIRQLFYIYDGKGSLKLKDGFLEFTSYRLDLRIPLYKIEKLGIGRFNRNQKPVTLNYLIIMYRNSDNVVQTIYFIPTNSPLTFVWNTNNMIKDWAREILRRSRKIKIIDSKYTKDLIV